MSATEAAQQVGSFFRRWSEIEDRKQEISDESKELFAEAKGGGYDTKAMRAVFRDMRAEQTGDKAKREEEEAIYDLYWSALTSALAGPRAHPAPAHEKTLRNLPPHDAVTGEIHNTQEQPETANHSQAKASTDNGGTSVTEDAPMAGEASRASVGAGTDATLSDADVPAFLKKDHPVKTARDYRTHCLNPEACAASGLTHCYSCSKAMADQSEAA